MNVLGWLFSIFLAGFIVMIIVFNVARVVYFIKCFRVKECSNGKCKFRVFCEKYHEVWTQEEIDLVNEMIGK